ncbi:kielin/chordin-like protein [Malaya genurostris]|uniref:kielin/chordin-like protein n=1 Tax=Malaya genurostris TaxID=325434 RepID=UPI0026F40163|nr:kielin/chordin-like protein [Malaya genurostris]
MMRSLLILATALVVGAAALKDGQVCEPGSNFMVDCNTCRCSADGKMVACTRKFCIPDVQSDDPKASNDSSNGIEREDEQIQTNGQVCTPNEVKWEECNRCKCAANGIGWFCTRKGCLPREKRATNVQRSAQQCTPGTSFKSADGCNDCFCTETGIAACTLKFCFPQGSLRKKREAPKECEPGSKFKSADGCNDCFCTETGIAACTLRFCLPPKQKRAALEIQPPATKQCVPGTSFKSSDGCNDCFCTDTGIAACTLKFCFPTKSKREAPAKQDCVPGTSFKSKDGCNDCFCTDNGLAVCTAKFCLTRSRRTPNNNLPRSEIAPGAPGFSCEPRKSFKFECNQCHCDSSGTQAACTFKYCVPGEY